MALVDAESPSDLVSGWVISEDTEETVEIDAPPLFLAERDLLSNPVLLAREGMTLRDPSPDKPLTWLDTLSASLLSSLSSYYSAPAPFNRMIYSLADIPMRKTLITPSGNLLLRAELTEVSLTTPDNRKRIYIPLRQFSIPGPAHSSSLLPSSPLSSFSSSSPTSSTSPPPFSESHRSQSEDPHHETKRSPSPGIPFLGDHVPQPPVRRHNSTSASSHNSSASAQYHDEAAAAELHRASSLSQDFVMLPADLEAQDPHSSPACQACISYRAVAQPLDPQPLDPQPLESCIAAKPLPLPPRSLVSAGSSSSLIATSPPETGIAETPAHPNARLLQSLHQRYIGRPGEQVLSITPDVTYLRLGIPTAGVLIISSYKLLFVAADGSHHTTDRVPLGCIASVSKVGRQITPGEHQYRIDLTCKDRAHILRFSFLPTLAHLRREPFRLLNAVVTRASTSLANCFALQNAERFPGTCGWHWYSPMSEFERLGVPCKEWRICTINTDYCFCPSYPQVFAVPAWVPDSLLLSVAAFRVKRRIPILSWRCSRTKATITRASQPKIGILSQRCPEDEYLVDSIRCATPGLDLIIIIDARPQINATVNRGAGGGYENTSTAYTKAILQFQGIGNIHVVSDALHRVWELCRCTESGQVDALGRWKWARDIERHWLSIISSVLTSATRIVQHLARGRSCFIHCSDGWDRTALLTSLAMMCLDPFYRTLKGFALLIEKEWLSAGHPFSLRYGNPTYNPNQPDPSSSIPLSAGPFASAPSLHSSPASLLSSTSTPSIDGVHQAAAASDHGGENSLQSQRSPTFPVFLDCVWQILEQHPRQFQFNSSLLRALGHHHVSGRFGTFLCDTERERKAANLDKLSVSFWAYVQNRHSIYLNPDWNEKLVMVEHPLALLPNYDAARLKFWWACYSNQPYGKWQRRLLHSPSPSAGDPLAASIAPLILHS